MASCGARRDAASAAGCPNGRLVDVTQTKRTHPLAVVVQAYGVALLRSGRVLMGCCPFHADTHPSMLVDERDDHFHCFGCGVHGDVLDFVQRIEGIGFRQAVERLSHGRWEACGAPIIPTAVHRAYPKGTSLAPAEHACLAAAAELYHNRLWSEPGTLAYVRGRGLEDETVRRWRVGYATGDTLVEYLRWRRIPLAAAREVGLLGRGDREHLAGRLVVPELRDGRPIWMIGRVLPPDDSGPKYLGLPGPKPLLGREFAQGAPIACVVEGVFDALVLSQWGCPAVALLGAHAGPAVLGDLARFARLYVILDDDEAGRAATAALQRSLGPRAVPVTISGIKDVADLALLPDGRARFAAAVRSTLQALAA